MFRVAAPALLLTFAFLQTTAWADEALPWPGRMGPHANGQVDVTPDTALPVVWSEAEKKGIAWKVPLEGSGHSTPVIGDGKLWFTAANKEGTQQFIYCLDKQTGAVIHHKLLFENATPEPLGNAINNYASPTCALEADAVYAHFGTYGTARLDVKTGEKVWERRDINVRHFRGPGSSPIVFEDLLILTFDGIDTQYLTAINKRTGENVWKTQRTTDFQDLDQNGKPRADGDLRKAYCTPVVVKVNGRPHLISCGSRAAFGYDARTGEELWTVTHGQYNASAPPLVFNDTVILNTGTQAHLISVKLDETTRGNVDKSHVQWDRARANSELSSPVLWKDRVYFLTGNGVITCVNAVNGEEVFKERIGNKFTASPLVAGNLIYCFDEAGLTTVLEAGDKYQVVAQNKLEEGMRSSPAAAHGALFLRTTGFLYKITR